METAAFERESSDLLTPSEATPLLTVEELTVTFNTPRGALRAVDHVSFSVAEGRTLGIVGESGSGKTVMNRALMGLLHDRNVVQGGRVLFDGKDITSLSRAEARRIKGRQIAMVFQDPMTSLNPVMKIGAQLTEGARTHLGLKRRAARELALSLLESVGMSDPARRMGQYPFELSGGMRQRVTTAIALACGPKLLIADEPTTALDVTVQAQILDLLQEKQRERGMAMLLVTHDLGVVAGRTDETLVMYAGQVVERAPTAALFTEARMPYTEALLRSIPRLEEPSHTPLVSIPGMPPDLTRAPRGCKFAPRCAYVQDRCREQEPPLRSDSSVGPDHLFACWFPVGGRPAPTTPVAEPSMADASLRTRTGEVLERCSPRKVKP